VLLSFFALIARHLFHFFVVSEKFIFLKRLVLLPPTLHQKNCHASNIFLNVLLQLLSPEIYKPIYKTLRCILKGEVLSTSYLKIRDMYSSVEFSRLYLSSNNF